MTDLHVVTSRFVWRYCIEYLGYLQKIILLKVQLKTRFAPAVKRVKLRGRFGRILVRIVKWLER